MTDPIGALCLGAAAAAWVGVLVGGTWGLRGVLLALAAVMVGWLGWGRRAWAVCTVLVVAGVIGWSLGVADAGIAGALAEDPGGPVVVAGRLASDGRTRPPPGHGWYAVLEPRVRDGRAWSGPPLLLSVDDGEPLPFGTEVEARGRLRPTPATIRGRPMAGVLAVRDVVDARSPGGLLGLAEAVRARVRDIALTAPAPGGPLVAGFLTGDTAAVDPVVVEDLRRAGLSHFVAVSGSNVALFLVGWWALTLPLSIHARTRWAVGLVGLVLFATITRWEPSVVRAAVMAGLFLLSRRLGIVVSAAGVLGLAVVGSLLVAPRLATDLGFALSVAATLGLLVGARRAGGRLRTALRATVSAQLAVAPILIGFVGEVPVASPLANLVAAPLVSFSTVTGGLATLLGLTPLAALAGMAADAVVRVARLVAPLPTLGWVGLLAVAGTLVVCRWAPVTRLPAVVAWLLVVGWMATGSGPGPGPWVAFLDVGQGDAAIVRGRDGGTIVVDGGPDPTILSAALDRYGVRRVELLAVSHRHADHVTGLGAIVGRLPVDVVWHPDHHELGSLAPLLEELDVERIPHTTPPVGLSASVGDLSVEVLGPQRRYASPNDESLVLLVRLGGMSVLFSGDAETFAQADLGPVRADVLKVPHQGGATSDLDWLAASAGAVSVISVGDNDYGHPSPDVVAVLAAAGSLVCRTDRGGDVLVRPGPTGPEVARRCPAVHSPP